MPEPAATPDAAGPQPKAALNYRLGGDHCHVCMYYTENADDVENGTCTRVTPPNVSGHDLCDDFKRAAHMREETGEDEKRADPMVDSLQRRGMISDKAMAGLRGRDY
jgi:hypothetical protein